MNLTEKSLLSQLQDESNYLLGQQNLNKLSQEEQTMSQETQNLIRKDPLKLYEIFSKLRTQNYKHFINNNELLRTYPIQHIKIVFQDIKKNTKNYLDKKQFLNFLTFIKYFNYENWQIKSQVYSFLQVILQQTKSFEIFQVIVQCCGSQITQQMLTILEPFRYKSNWEVSQLQNLKILFSGLNQEDRLVFQNELQTIFQTRVDELKIYVVQKLKQNPYEKLFKNIWSYLDSQKKSKFIEDFTNFKIQETTKQPIIIYNPNYLHKDILTLTNLKHVVVSEPQLYFSKISQSLFKLETDTVISFINEEVINYLFQTYLYIPSEKKELLDRWWLFLQALLENLEKEIKMVSIIKQGIFHKVKYVCKIFILCSNLNNDYIPSNLDIVCQLLYQKIIEGLLEKKQQEAINDEKFIKAISQTYRLLLNSMPKQQKKTKNMIQILQICSGQIKLGQEYYQLLFDTTQIQNLTSKQQEELRNLYVNFLEKCYEHVQQQLYIYRINPFSQKLVCNFLEDKLTKLQKINKVQIETNKQKISKQIEFLSYLFKVPQLKNQKLRQLMAKTFAKYYLQIVQNKPYHLSSFNKLYAWRDWICKFSSQEFRIKQHPQHLSLAVQSFNQHFNKMTPIMKQWGYKQWLFPNETQIGIDFPKQFPNFITSILKMNQYLHIKTFEFQQYLIQSIMQALFNLDYILHEAQHKCLEYLHTLNQQDLEKQRQKRKIQEFVHNGQSVYSTLFQAFRKIKKTISFYFIYSSEMLSLKEQTSFFKYIGKELKNIILSSKIQHQDQSYYQDNLKIAKSAILLNLVNFWISRSCYQQALDSFPLQEADDHYQEVTYYGQYKYRKINLLFFSSIYSEIQQNWIEICRNLVEGYNKAQNTYIKSNNKHKIPIIIGFQKEYYIFYLEKEIYETQRQSLYTQIYDFLDNFINPNLTIGGACLFNGQLYEHETQGMGFGIIYHQISSILHSLDFAFLSEIKCNNLLFGKWEKLKNDKQYMLQAGFSNQQIQIAFKHFTAKNLEDAQNWIIQNRQNLKTTLEQQKIKLQNSHNKIYQTKIIPLSAPEYAIKIQNQISKTLEIIMEKMKTSESSQKHYEMAKMLIGSTRQTQKLQQAIQQWKQGFQFA